MTSANGQPNPKTMRLPGSVAEIEASPAGPEVGAFFDLDGTLVAGFTGVIMTQDRLRRRQMSVGEFIGMVQAGLNHQLNWPSGSSNRRSSVASIRRCANSSALTWPADTPWYSARRR